MNDIESKVEKVISYGLVSGWGQPVPGQLCVEAAICLALGEPHKQMPSCVGEPQHQFAMRLNDACWPSDSARAEGMLPFALAELGTADFTQVQQQVFVEHVVFETIRRLIPKALRVAASVQQNEEHRSNLERCAKACEESTADTADAAYSAAARSADAGRAARAAADAAYSAARAADASDELLTESVRIGVEAIEKARRQ